MGTVRETYTVSVHPGREPGSAGMRLADMIVQRWMPNNAGGARLLLVPQLCQRLIPLFQKATTTRRDVVLVIDTRSPQVQITEISR